jgi:hypothetical protein
MSQDLRQTADKFEVTPEMAAAGGKVIFENPSLCEDGWDELAAEVYVVMEAVRQRCLMEAACSGSQPSCKS